MNTLEILLERRWILKHREKDLYYKVKDDVGGLRSFLMEKLGYQIVVNPYLIKVEKLPARPEAWMGITEFKDKREYVFFCLVLMFLEDASEQFILSQLTEYIQAQYREEDIDWTEYLYRRQLIRVLKYCVKMGILTVNDGSEDAFASDGQGEVLYENTGVARYFMRTFTQDILHYTDPKQFEKEEWIGVDEDRGIVRRQRVYRALLMTPGLYKDVSLEEDFAYIRNQRNFVGGDLADHLDCELQVHRNSVFLILGENCHMGRTFPEDNVRSDIVLLFHGIVQEKIHNDKISVGPEELILISEEYFLELLELCRKRYRKGFIKTFRDMTTQEFCMEMMMYMLQLGFVRREHGSMRISTAAGKIIGKYPESFLEQGGENE